MIRSAVILLSVVAFAEDTPAISSVGVPARIEQLVLPGTLLEAKPLTDRRLPVVVRIVAAYPHGDAYRYDMEYFSLEPGTYDLREYLQREDGSAMEDVPPIVFEVRSMLPPGQIQPNVMSPGRLPSVGGYRMGLIVGGVFWVVGLLAILLVGRRRKTARHSSTAHLATLEERLQAAIQAAGEGELDAGERAELERMVLAYWRQRLSLEDVEASEAMAAMRRNEESRSVLEQLEQWLHHPSGRDLEDFKRLVNPSSEARTTEQN